MFHVIDWFTFDFYFCNDPFLLPFGYVIMLCSFQICLLCRERGHSLKNCPEKSEGNLKKFCYNCGESGHALSKCPKPIENGNPHTSILHIFWYFVSASGVTITALPMWFHSLNTIVYTGGTKFASCFVCKQQGHLSKDCPENKHGIYPKVFNHTLACLLNSVCFAYARY